MKARPWFGLLLVAALALGFAFLVFPVVAIFFHTAPSKLVSSLGDEASTDALRLSLETSTIAMAAVVAVGTPAAYWLATRVFKAKPVLVAMLELPLVLPPAVAGIGLFAAFGRFGLLGGVLRAVGVEIPFTQVAVVMALAFVASPFYVRQAHAAFAAVDPELLGAARTLGAGPGGAFWRVGVPVARQGLSAGAALAWARALGEFGATIMFAGNFVGRTQTMPLAIYQSMESDLNVSLTLSTILVVASFAVLLVFRLLVRRGVPGG